MNDSLTIEKYLSKQDIVLAKLIQEFGSCTILDVTPSAPSPFDTLVSSVISQQLSSKVSEVIINRLEIIAGNRPFKPGFFLNENELTIRKCGISNAKIKTIRGLADHALLGMFDIEVFERLTDDEVVKYLSSFWGVGHWTANMFLMFHLRRLDILPLNDAGLNRAHLILYPNAKSLITTSEFWKPYRTVGCWYMWQHIDK